MYVKTLSFSWIIFILHLVLSYTDKLSVIPMGANCAPIVADLSLFCCEIDFMTSLSNDNQADIIKAFNAKPSFFGSVYFLSCRI